MTSRALVKQQLRTISSLLSDPDEPDEQKTAKPSCNPKKRRRGERQDTASRGRGGQTHVRDNGSRRRKTGSFSMDELREQFRAKDHTAANVKALSRGASEKHTNRTRKLVKSLLAMNRARTAAAESDSDSDTDERSVDMYKTLKMMKARGM